MANYALVDDFESYTSGTFSSIWKNVANMPPTLAINSGRMNNDPVHANKQGMAIAYNYLAAGSGATVATFTAAQDWTSRASGAVALSFWMRGKGNNPALTNSRRARAPVRHITAPRFPSTTSAALSWMKTGRT